MKPPITGMNEKIFMTIAENKPDDGDDDQGKDVVDPAGTTDLSKNCRKMKCLADAPGPGKADNTEKREDRDDNRKDYCNQEQQHHQAAADRSSGWLLSHRSVWRSDIELKSWDSTPDERSVETMGQTRGLPAG